MASLPVHCSELGMAHNKSETAGWAEPCANALSTRVAALEHSPLAAEDTLFRESMSQAERRWLRSHRSKAAAHWNLLTDLKLEDLGDVYSERAA
jgi:hypothetical protein